MGAADDEDEIRFDFRDPFLSDGDDVDDEYSPKDEEDDQEIENAPGPAPGFADIDYDGNQVSQRHDAGVTYQQDPHIVGESSECKTPYRFIRASHLEKSLEATLLEWSVLGGQQSKEGRSNSVQGASSEVHASEIVVLGILPTLEDDLGSVLDRLRDLSEEALETTILPSQSKECTYMRLDYPPVDGLETEEVKRGEFRPPLAGVHEGTWTQSSAQVTIEPSETAAENSSARRPKLVIRIRKKDIRRLNRERRLLQDAQSERDTGSREFEYSDSEAATRPTQRSEVVEDVGNSCSSPCQGTDEATSIVKNVAVDDAVGPVKHAITAEHEELTSAESSLEAIPDMERQDIRREVDCGQKLETPSMPPAVAFEPGELQQSYSVRQSRRDTESGLSLWQRMEQRFVTAAAAVSFNFFICSICGTQQNFVTEGDNCKICSDKQRNFQPLDYIWYPVTDVDNLDLTYLISPLHEDMTFQLFTNPMSFQAHRAILLRLPSGNIMWDCLTYIDEKTVVKLAQMGGLRAIALSSPQRISACSRLSYIFNRCSVYLHASGREFMAKDVGRRARKFWEGSTEILWDGVTLIHLGGRYPGSCILHLDRKGGIVFASNTLKVGEDRESVAIMLDYCNFIPAPQKDVERILHVLEDLEFNELWGDQPGEQILDEAKPKVISSLRRYLRCAEQNEDVISSETEQLSKRELIARGKRKINEM